MDLESQGKLIQPLIERYRNYPDHYFKERLNMKKWWDGELQMLDAIPKAIRDKKNIVVTSGHALGKDYICGGLVPYFLEVWGPCIVINTAPTDRQVKEVMWGEIQAHYANAETKPPGILLTQKIDIAPKWYAIGFTTKETGSMVGKFQSFHARRVFVIVSEAQAVADTIYQQIDSILTGQVGLQIMIGNPLRATGQFARAIDNKKSNIVIRLDCELNPNFLEDREVVPGLCSRGWVMNKRKVIGPGYETDPRYLARVKGIKPKTSIDTIFSEELVEKMINRETRQTQMKRGVGVDVARFGDDECVIYGGTNGKVEASDIYADPVRTNKTASRAVIINNKIGKGNFIAVDTTGLGSGTADTLVALEMEGVDIIEIESASTDRKIVGAEYHNLRAQMWFTALQRAMEGKASIPNDPVLIEELKIVTFWVNNRGLIQIESKEELKEPDRLGHSPNRADGWIYLQWGFEQSESIKNQDKWAEQTDSQDSGVEATVAGKGGMVG